MAICSFFMVVVAILALVLRILLQRENRAVADDEDHGTVDPGEEREELMGGGRRDDLEGSGDQRLVYII
jgi:hypothetical protein